MVMFREAVFIMCIAFTYTIQSSCELMHIVKLFNNFILFASVMLMIDYVFLLTN